MDRQGRPDEPQLIYRRDPSQAYAEQDVLLAFAVARLFPEVKSNSLGPRWVYQDGRRRSTRRHRQGTPDTGLVADERPTSSGGFRQVFLSPEASGSGSCYDGR
jgi:hypothetical protein